MKQLAAVLLALSLVTLQACAAEPQTVGFDNAKALADWQVKGPVTVDAGQHHGEAGSAMQLGAKASAIWKLRDTDGGGKVDFWVYEDGTTRENEKDRGAGPLYGLITAEGRMLVVGAVYAPYLAGNTTYCVSEFLNDGKEQPYFKVSYLGLKRSVGWHRWTFDFNPQTGLKLLHNGQEQKRYDWAQSEVKGFAGVVALGDRGPGQAQTGWLDDLTVEQTDGPVVDPAKLRAAQEAAAAAEAKERVPDTDPPLEGPERTIVPELMSQHPRLLFDAGDIPELQAFAKTPMGKIFMDQLTAYLGASKPPDTPKFLTDATDGQRQGYWRLPTVALDWVLTGNQESFDSAVGFLKLFLSLPHWETGGELDSGMSSANIMMGAALAFDWLYNDLDPEFREQFRQKLWFMARRQYYLGHLMHQPGTHYWQGDPQNNHRWHRNAGMSLAALAAYTGDESQQWFMSKLYDEMKYVADWLPGDGTSHESPGYMIFGASHLTIGMQATDRCFGTHYLEQPFFAHVPSFMLQTETPGLKQRFHYGDQGGTGVGKYNYDVFELKCIGANNRKDLLGLVNERLKQDGVDVVVGWLGLLWYPRHLQAAPVTDAPLHDFFSDLGVQFMRDSWEPGGRGAMFKCGPFGGYLLNTFSHENGGKYINVAHDDPDANSFILFKDDEFVAESDRYSASKKSANLNTILINGLGQIVGGRTEGGTWSQPGGDMSHIAVITSTAANGQNLGIEGEAAGSYAANPKQGKRPALDRYRRTFLWVPGRYVLVLDDIRAPSKVDLDWLMQSGEVQAGQGMRWLLVKGAASCGLQVAATEPMTATIVDSPADSKKKLLGWKQLRLHANSSAIRIASVYDLWDRGNLTATVQVDGPDHAVVKVTGGGVDDTWDWTAGDGRFGPSKVIGADGAGKQLLTLSEPEPETRALIEAIEAVDKKAQG